MSTFLKLYKGSKLNWTFKNELKIWFWSFINKIESSNFKGINTTVKANEEEKQDDLEQHRQSNFIKMEVELELDSATSATDDKKDETDR